MNYNKFAESFLDFESTNNMFDINIKGVHIWHYIRNNIFWDMLNSLNDSELMINVNNPKNRNIDTYKDWINKNVVCNQFFTHKRDVLIIPHERKYHEDKDYYKCLYTSLLDKKLIQSHYILDKISTEGVFAKQRSKNIVYFDLKSFMKIKNIKYPNVSISKTEVEEKIIQPIENYFEMNIDFGIRKKWYDYVKNRINFRKIHFEYFDYMLHRITPKLIIMVVSYDPDRMVLCEVAHKWKIPIVELQHGYINKETIPYNFIGVKKLSSFPDYIFSFGNFLEKIRFPILSENVIPVGCPELEKYCKPHKQNGDKKTILFISQGYSELAEYAFIAANMLDPQKFHIIFKLHPKEYYSWKKNMGKYLNNSNINVIGNYEHTIHELLGNADWVIGSYSTVLYEATMFDVKIAIVKVGLYCVADLLYNNRFAILVDSPEHLIREIENDTFVVNKDVSLFKKNGIENMQKNIDKIIGVNQKN